MTRRGLPALILGLVLGLGGLQSCRGGGEPVDDAASRDPSLLPARALYRYHCVACHGRNGGGAQNLFPPLAGSEWVLGNPEIPIRIVLHGFQGEIRVRGNRYLNHMTALGHRLSDEDIAAVLTYVRASWGNGASPVDPALVERVRREHQDRDRPWSPEELEPLGLGAVNSDSSGAPPAPS